MSRRPLTGSDIAQIDSEARPPARHHATAPIWTWHEHEWVTGGLRPWEAARAEDRLRDLDALLIRWDAGL